jgi:hypothetical protein
MEEYLSRNFSNAITLFTQVQKLLPGDFVSGKMLERCRTYEHQDLPPDWQGVEVMRTK